MKLLELDAYVTGELTGADVDAFEEALFDAPDDQNVVILDRLARHGRELAAHGTFAMGVPRTHIEKLRAEGVKIQLLDGGPPTLSPPTMMKLDLGADLICTCLDIGRKDVDMVDVELTLSEYNATKVIRDALVDRSEGVLYGLCERSLAEQAWGHGMTNVKVRERDGARALIAEWNFIGSIAPATP